MQKAGPPSAFGSQVSKDGGSGGCASLFKDESPGFKEKRLKKA